MTFIASLVVIAVIAMLWRRGRPQVEPRPADAVSPEAELLQLCRGDAAKMRRLIALEQEAAPSMSRSDAIRRAIERLRRDHR